MKEQLNIQALEALSKANRVRSARAADKRSIKLGDLDPITVLLDPPEHWGSAQLVDLFLAMNRVGRRRANKWCAIEDVSTGRRLDALTDRQRKMFAVHIDVWSRKRDQLRLTMEKS